MPSLASTTPRSISRFFATQLLVVATACFACGLSDAATLPTPPQTFDATYAKPTGRMINVAAGGNFQTALVKAQLGDTIVLQAGATYTGPFTLSNKTAGTGWIYVISNTYASLPAPGKRVGPSDAANMPKIVSPANNNAMVTVANSHHFRFVGIEFVPAAGAFVYNLISIGSADISPATLPNHIVFDRCYIHGDPTGEGRRGILMNGAYIAVIDSYVSDFKQRGFDTQALLAYNGSGPFKIANNYLEAAGENIMFGGADSAAASLVPADIEISNNHFFKPLSLIGSEFTVKNLLEFKATQRALVSGNTFENNPAAAQNGFALLVTPRNQDGAASWSITTDITIVGNTFINVGSGLNIAGQDDIHPSLPTARVLIRNNLLGVTGLNGADGRTFQILSGASDITIDHNTIVNVATAPATCCSDLVMADNAPLKTNNLVFTNNLSTRTSYGFFGSALGEGINALNGEFANWLFLKNVIVGANAANYPAGNFFPANLGAVRFVDYASGDYMLAAGSPYKNAGTDGLDIGANLSSIKLPATSVVAPTNPPTNIVVR
jgi:Right handed beta helix region